MKTYLVTEGPTDAAILTPLLAALGLDDVTVAVAGGRARLTSFARSLAVVKRANVAVVMDADTSKPDRVQEQAIIFRDLTTHTERRDSVRLFQAIPTLEDALFPRPDDFERLLNVRLTDEQKTAFRGRRSHFVKNWFDEAQGPGIGKDLVRSNEGLAKRALDRAGLAGLFDYLSASAKSRAYA